MKKTVFEKIKKIPLLHNLISYYLEKKFLRGKNKEFKKYIKGNKKSIYIVQTPTHSNIGDSAIILAQTAFLNKLFLEDNLIDISLKEFKLYKKQILDVLMHNKRPVFFPGGGNMGNQWLVEEKPRQEIIAKLRKNNIIIFPQTIFFTPDSAGEEKTKSVDFYNEDRLTIVAREKKSYELMSELYPKAHLLLTPDIVLSMKATDYGVKKQDRKGVLFIMRNDAERAMNEADRTCLYDDVKAKGLQYTISDMHSDQKVTKKNRDEIVKAKMEEFASAKLVITDRLHGMIFAAVTGTPCIVFSNYNHKVKGTYDWIRYLPYIKYVDNANDAKKMIPDMLEMQDCKYDNQPLMPYFDQLKEVVKNAVN